MNNQLISRLITSNLGSCPELSHENPLLDKNVTSALSKSFIKILSKSNNNSNLNNNVRLSILQNIRILCQAQPANHTNVDENFTTLLTDFYEQHFQETLTTSCSIQNNLDKFLVRRMKNLNMKSSYETSLNPDTIQALINLNENGLFLETLSQNILHWDTSSVSDMKVLKTLWSDEKNSADNIDSNDDVSIKFKQEIEKDILDGCHLFLVNRDLSEKEYLSNHNSFSALCLKCSKSKTCFEISTGILNYIFIMSNFDPRIQSFVQMFISLIKVHAGNISHLYPICIGHYATLLDIDFNGWPVSIKERYIMGTLSYFKKDQLNYREKSNLILLLSHFPQWWDIFYSN